MIQLKHALPVLAATALLAGCTPSEEELAAREAEEAVRALPQPSPRLHLAEDDQLTLEAPSRGFSTTHYLYGRSRTQTWTYPLAGETLQKDPRYQVIMASKGKTRATLEVVVARGGKETVIGRDSFVVDSTLYQPYTGQFSASEIPTEKGDRLIVRLTAAGSDFGLQCGTRKSSVWALKAPSPLPTAIAEQREKALIWFAANNKWGMESDPFRNFHEALDDAILSDESVEWRMGWGLTRSGNPFVLKWTVQAFETEKVTMEKAGELEMKENSLVTVFPTEEVAGMRTAPRR